MTEHVGTFTTGDELALRERSWMPGGEPRAVVGLLHGGADHRLAAHRHTERRAFLGLIAYSLGAAAGAAVVLRRSPEPHHSSLFVD